MYQDYYQYLQWLQNCVQIQDRRILELERLVRQLSEELKQIKERPAIHVDTIEYKFDQLKVETVEGTLNIGLNPADLQGIEDLAVNDQTPTPPVNPKGQMVRSMAIEEGILNYLETDLPHIITDIQNQLNIEPNEEYFNFIKEDIKKQLPSRIDFHLKAAAEQIRPAANTAALNEQIMNNIKQEIENGVSVFFKNFPNNMKGMKQQ